ncbi:MAG TPA: phage holin family protein [Candidatus Limnocylindrales bacterium]|nr:phage holin family protein [Candidatus Limnocylindrales bacterium]
MIAHILINWLVGALALWIVARIIPGIQVRGFGDALLATIVIAIVNGLLGPILRFFAWPITFLTFGLFLWVINAMLLKVASLLTPGFKVRGFLAALLGSLVLTVLTSLLRWAVVR